MAEVFNDFFATIGSNLASEIQPSTIEPEFYLQPTDTIFSLKPPSASTVCRLLNQLDTNKATGLDRIDLYHAAAMLSPRGTKTFFFARPASH